MHCALPPFEPPDGVLKRRLALAVVGGARPRGDRHLSAIARLQGFSSCSPAAFPHQWAVWWGDASGAAASAPPSASRIFVILAEAEGGLSRGSPLRRQRPTPSFSDLGEGRSPPVALVAAARLAFRHERLWCCLRCRPHRWSLLRRWLLGGRMTCRTPRGQCSCSGTAPFSFLWRGRE
jgi:hypothetical protein